jgi:hypothetical protein
LTSSASFGAVSCGGVQNTVSRMVCPISAAIVPGAQWPAAAIREKDMALSGFERAAMRPSAKTISAAATLSWAAAIRASRSRNCNAAICAAPATAGAKRLE